MYDHPNWEALVDEAEGKGLMETIEVMAATVAESLPMFIAGNPVYITGVNSDQLGEKRCRVYAKSKSGRYIEIWLAARYLKDFRAESMTTRNPIYSDIEMRLRGRDEVCDMKKSLLIIYAYCHILGLNLPSIMDYGRQNGNRVYLDRALVRG